MTINILFFTDCMAKKRSVLVSTKKGQSWGRLDEYSDFSFVPEGDIVTFANNPDEWDSMVSMQGSNLRGTTTFKCSIIPLSINDWRRLVQDQILRSGGKGLSKDELGLLVDQQLNSLMETCNKFPPESVLERGIDGHFKIKKKTK